MTYTLDQVHALYNANEAALDAMSKRHAEEMDPLNKKKLALKAWMLDYLNREQLDKASTPHGTVFKSTATSVTVEDWEQVVSFILDDIVESVADSLEKNLSEEEALVKARSVPRWSFLNRAVNKTAVTEHLEQHNVLPPGVKMTQVVQVNTRRA